MLEVWLMRHGEAVDPDRASSDAARSLTECGRRQVASLARWLKGRCPPPDRVIHSPLRRAVETAGVFAAEWELDGRLDESSMMAPGMTCTKMLGELSRHGWSQVLCVGHQPDIGRCLAEMIGGGQAVIPPGFCAAIRFNHSLRAGAGSLVWVADPAWFDAC